MTDATEILRESLVESLRQCQHLTIQEFESLQEDLGFLESTNQLLRDEYAAASERVRESLAKERESIDECKSFIFTNNLRKI